MTRELSDEARSLIRAAVAEEPRPGSAHRDRLRRGVLVRAAAGGAVTLVGSSVAKAAGGHALFATVASCVGLGFGAGLVLAGAAQVAFGPSAQSRPNEPSAPVPSTARAPHDSVRSAALSPSVAPSTAARGASEGSRAASDWGSEPASSKARTLEGVTLPGASAAPSSSLRAELDLMARVQGALRDGRGARALELIALYDARHPSGVLETERLAAEVFAACDIGDSARARRVAAHFLARDPVSALAQRVKNACSVPGSEAP